MAPKDYYTILGLLPGSTLNDIKRSYRRLVMEFHPDKNQGNPYSSAHFREIREAYDVLSDPRKREDYHLQRGYWKSTGRAFADGVPITPHGILLQARTLRDNVGKLDLYRMDHGTLQGQILALLSEEHLAQLDTHKDSDLNGQVVSYVMESASPLPFPLADPVIRLLFRLSARTPGTEEKIASFRKQKKRAHFVDKYKTLVLILLSLGLCYLAYRLAS